MSQTELQKQAIELETLLPKTIRTVFRLKPGHLSTELPLAQLRLCLILMQGRRSLSSIGEELGASSSAATQIADRLEKAGMIERTCCPEDRRVKHIQLTEYGIKCMEDRQKERLEDAETTLSHLSEEARERVMSALRELLSAAQKSIREDSDS